MKIHYINILLFAVPLNILLLSSQVYNQRNHNVTLHKSTTTLRLLCECELYAPSNYDNDPHMKEVMEIFDRQTSERFHEYDERMKTTRQKCKDKCDKEIQKIILKDKLEKQMAQQLTTLDPNITTEDIPTCICEKSLADKTEKFCLNCGKTMGGVAPGWGLVSGLWYATWTQYVTQAPIQKGIEAVISILEDMPGITDLPGFNLANIINPTNYSSDSLITNAIYAVAKPICDVPDNASLKFCMLSSYNGSTIIKQVSGGAKSAATFGEQTTSDQAAILAQKSLTLTNSIAASFIAIVVIVL
ncbi:hypothetical protein PFAG_03630, partial [Plasmodium falciparum Santa Lucia]